MTERQKPGGEAQPAVIGPFDPASAPRAAPQVRTLGDQEPPQNFGAPVVSEPLASDWQYGGPALFGSPAGPVRKVWRQDRPSLRVEFLDAPPPADPFTPEPSPRERFARAAGEVG